MGAAERQHMTLYFWLCWWCDLWPSYLTCLSFSLLICKTASSYAGIAGIGLKHLTSMDNIGKEPWRACVGDEGTRKDRVLDCGEDTLDTREGTLECGPSPSSGGSGCVQGWMEGQRAREEDRQQTSHVPASSASGLPEALLHSPQAQCIPGSTPTGAGPSWAGEAPGTGGRCPGAGSPGVTHCTVRPRRPGRPRVGQLHPGPGGHPEELGGPSRTD